MMIFVDLRKKGSIFEKISGKHKVITLKDLSLKKYYLFCNMKDNEYTVMMTPSLLNSEETLRGFVKERIRKDNVVIEFALKQDALEVAKRLKIQYSKNRKIVMAENAINCWNSLLVP